MSVIDTIKRFAQEDIKAIYKAARAKYKMWPMKLIRIETEKADTGHTIYCTAILEFYNESTGESFDSDFTWGYEIRGDEVFMADMDELVEYFFDSYYMDSGEYDAVDASPNAVTSSTHQVGKAILAAEGDEDEGVFIDEDFSEDDLSGQLDDISDQMEDIQDQVDDFEEDDVDIDTNNNITDHYIAECDSCHGVFISAVIKSDQEIDKITGICPLCEKETDQYLKWVIKDANSEE